ncbi:hypothetical protein DYB32_008136 [Aphanomyces invadans]|uniref:Uncharacterized protein n=1 Tax=Aphanomyces invadans TaxID=157072 RepID=A0A418AM16_9STRA|nr:hypothetical protein DYB32_008136 [Aphanomyces invadans]
MGSTFDRGAYLERIKLSVAPTDASLAFLDTLLQHHRQSIPFENLAVCGAFPVSPAHVEDVSVERVSLDADKIFQKLVVDNRGGYCFEQNALLAAALRAFGYTVDTLSARALFPIASTDPAAPPAFEFTGLIHMILLVTVHNVVYLVDVGFGGRGQPPAALALNESSLVQAKGGEVYQMKQVQIVRELNRPNTYTGGFQLSEPGKDLSTPTLWALYYKPKLDDEFRVSYVFSSTDSMAHADYLPSNWFCSTSPKSPLAPHVVCVLRTERGLKCVHDMTFKHLECGEWIESTTLESKEALLDVLKSHIGLVPPAHDSV